jgi:cytochrome c oxidase subunit 2
MTFRRSGWPRPLPLLALVVLAALFAAGCAEDAPQDALDPQGPFARKADNLWDLVFWIAVAVFVVAEGLLLFILFRFRRRSADDRPKQTHGNTRLEMAWTLAPAVILAAIAVPTVVTIVDLADEPEDAYEIEVVGHQWWWEFRYPENGVVTANDLVIPNDRPVVLRITSVDVIHSFWVPRLAGKIDAVPGQTNDLLIQSDSADEFFGQCAEFCGESHANMRFRVISREQPDFDAWLAAQAQPARAVSGDAAAGQELFLQANLCAACHAINGTSAAARVGPDLTHFMSRGTFAGAIFENNEENLNAWLDDPPAQKPGSLMPDYDLTEEQIRNLVAFLQTLE